LLSSIKRSDKIRTIAASGTLTKKAARQLTCSISQPPITGPIAVVIALNPDHVPIALLQALAFAVDVVGAEDDVLKPKAFPCDPEISLDRHLGNAIGIDRLKGSVFSRRLSRSSVDRRARGVHETLDIVIDAGVDEIGASDDVDFVVVPANMVAQAFRREPGEMKHVDEMVLGKKTFNAIPIENRPLNETGSSV